MTFRDLVLWWIASGLPVDEPMYSCNPVSKGLPVDEETLEATFFRGTITNPHTKETHVNVLLISTE